MKIIELSEKQRKKIVNCVKPRPNDYYSYQNLDLLTAVFDEEKKIYLTLTYYLSSTITRTDVRYDEHTYILLTRLGTHFIHCTGQSGEYKGIFSPVPILISSKKIQQMIQYYKDAIFERIDLRKEATKKFNLEGKHFTEWYLENHYFNANPR